MGGVCCKCRWWRRRTQQGDGHAVTTTPAAATATSATANSINNSLSVSGVLQNPTETYNSTPSSTSLTEIAGAGRKGLEAVQVAEDARRIAMLPAARHAAAHMRRNSVRARNKNTNIAYRTALNQVTHAIVCSSCGWRAGNASDASINNDKASCVVLLDDGDHCITLPYALKYPKGKKQGGVRDVLAAPPSGRVWSASQGNGLEVEATNAVCKGCHCLLGLVVGGATYLCVRYVRVVDVRAGVPLFPRTELSCVACACVLSHADQILCTRRRWSLADTPSQSACYMNGLEQHNIVVHEPHEMHLAQGRFLMADVHCKCGVQVGYKFCKDLSGEGRNVYQVYLFFGGFLAAHYQKQTMFFLHTLKRNLCVGDFINTTTHGALKHHPHLSGGSTHHTIPTPQVGRFGLVSSCFTIGLQMP